MSTYPGIVEVTTGSPAAIPSMSTMPKPSPPSEGSQRTPARGLLEVAKGAVGSRSKVVCDALILDEASRSDTYPYIRIDESDVDIGHEATVSKIGSSSCRGRLAKAKGPWGRSGRLILGLAH